MKQIQWYPGHMFKSIKEIKVNVKLVDIVLVLLDARLPLSSMNPDILTIVKTKPCVMLFNKSNLADDAELNKWLSIYQFRGFKTLKIDALSGKNVNRIHSAAKEVLKDKIARDEKRGIKQRAFKTMILGIPNVGKSTLINKLTNSSATKTANTPGVTRVQQWVRLSSEFELLDTPGVLWPKFDLNIGFKLAITGAITDRILPLDEVAHKAVEIVRDHYPDRITQRYGFNPLGFTPAEIVEKIGLVRNAVIKNNEIDFERVYGIVLKDIRNGQLGGLTFDFK